MTSTPKLQKSYDTILVGHTPGALLMANNLRAQGRSFCILDSHLFSVEPLKFFPALKQDVFTDLSFLAGDATSQAPSLPNALTSSLPEPVSVAGPPLTFGKGKFKSFQGFGAAKVEAADEYLRYCKECFSFADQPEALLKELHRDIEDCIFSVPKVTDLTFDGHQITEIRVNGSQSVKGKNFVFFNHLSWLLETLAKVETSLSVGLKKMKWFSTVHINYFHPIIGEDLECNTPYLLMGSKELPCLGYFRQAGENQALSQWETYIPAELTMDSETTGFAVKEIKKQVKRAFASSFGPTTAEQIVIRQKDISDLRGVAGKLSKFENLKVISPLLEGHRGWSFEMAMAGDSPSTDAVSVPNETSDEIQEESQEPRPELSPTDLL